MKGQKVKNSNLTGIIVFAGGMFMFSFVDTLAKYLTTDFHPIQVAWARQVGLMVGILLIIVMRGPGILKTAHPKIQISRGVLAAGSATMFIYAVASVPIADAVAVSFVAPFFVTVLGALVLKEAVGVRRWTAIAIGFVACLIIIRPGLGVFHPAMFFVILAASFYALRQIVSRVLSTTDKTITTVAYTALTAGVLLSIPLPFIWVTPVWGPQIWLLLALTLAAGLAEVLVIRALELAQAVVLAPVHYTLLIWGTIYGWFVFGQLPDGWTWFGSAIIVVTGIYMVRREWALKQAGT